VDQDIRMFDAVDGIRLATATSGSGFPLVKAANWLSHLEHDRSAPDAPGQTSRPRVGDLTTIAATPRTIGIHSRTSPASA
jgi:hypothetical protein